MTLTILISDLTAARKLLTRIRFERLKLPVLTHILATVDAAGLSLAVTDLDHWLETRLSAVVDPFAPARFLIPAEALKAAASGDKRSHAHFAFANTPEGSTLTLTVPRGGMNVVSVHHPQPVEEFPERPTVGGGVSALAKETFAALRIVAGCASTDATRYVLNGVLFSPDNGGTLVATNGRMLAAAPVRFTGREFILPSTAAAVLIHPDFAGRDAAICQEAANESVTRVVFRSGPHTFVAKTIEGTYPNYRQVIPGEHLAEAVIPETHGPALVTWLRSLSGRRGPVILTAPVPGHLDFTLDDPDSETASIRVPVTITGQVPVIAFESRYLADALDIGPTLRFTDGMSAALTTAPSGAICVLMPNRCNAATATHHANIPPATQSAAA